MNIKSNQMKHVKIIMAASVLMLGIGLNMVNREWDRGGM